jgi:hypothetical protein
MNPLIVMFETWLSNDDNFNYELDQEHLEAYLIDNFAYLNKNQFMRIMTLPEFVIAVNNECTGFDAICLISEETYKELLKRPYYE